MERAGSEKPDDVAKVPLVEIATDADEVTLAKIPVEFAEAVGTPLTIPVGLMLKTDEVKFKLAVLEGKRAVELIIAVAFTTAVIFVVILVLCTGSRQLLYIPSHIETKVSSPEDRQVSSAVAHLFLH